MKFNSKWIHKVTRPQWIERDDPKSFFGGEASALAYEAALADRREKYPVNTNKYPNIVRDLEENGFHILKNAIDAETIANLKEEFAKELNKGQNLLEHNQHFSVIAQPLLHCPTATKLTFSDLALDITSEFFKCTPSVGTFNFRRSYVNSDSPWKHQLYHVDKNSIKFLKFFIYLNDVKEVGDGPLTLVPDSLHKKFVDWDDPHRYRRTQEEVEAIYGPGSVKYMLANAGDLVIARTTCFHCGTKPENTDRTMLTLNYVVHPEEWRDTGFKMKKEDFDNLPENKKPMTDFLEKV